MMAVSPLAQSDTEAPCNPVTEPEPASLACCVQTPPFLVQTQAAPESARSCGPPTMAVLPSEEMDTAEPCCARAADPRSGGDAAAPHPLPARLVRRRLGQTDDDPALHAHAGRPHPLPPRHVRPD